MEPKTKTEINFAKHIDTIENELPLLYPLPKQTISKSWKSQIELQKKALDSRLWSVKSKTARLEKHAKPQYFQSDLDKEDRIQKNRIEKQAIQKAKLRIRDRYRSTKLLEHQQRDADQLAQQRILKGQYEEAALTRGLMEDYLKQQRKALIEERREQTVAHKLKEQQRLKREADLEYQLQDRIQMVKEEIKDLENHELLILNEEAKVYDH